MMPSNGDKVVYTGSEIDGLTPGVHGHVLSATAAYAHVQWLEGSRAGQVGLHSVDDLGEASSYSRTVAASLDDCLEVGSLVSLASAQEAYEETGSDGLVEHLASGGHLSAYASVAEDVLQQVTGLLQQDPVLHQLTAQMDPDEADEVLRRAAMTLLSDSGDF
jgi:hypothetical protein